MDNIDKRNSHKRAFLDFLDQNACKDEIKAMVNHKRRRLVVNISDLHAFQDFGPRILKNPIEYMQPFCDAATDIARSIDLLF